MSTPRELPWVTRPGEWRTLFYSGGITDVLVSPGMSLGFSMLESQFDPGATSGERPVDDSDEQGGFVPEGELTIGLKGNEEPVTLRANDSFQLPARRRFRYANLADAPARVVWVFARAWLSRSNAASRQIISMTEQYID